MGGFSGETGGGGSGVPDTIRPPKVRKKEIAKGTVKKIASMSPTGAILNAISKGIENNKKERAADVNLGTADYQGSPTGRKSRVRTRQVGGDNDNNNQNSAVQPKVISQMDAPTPDLTTTGPTEVEMAAVPEVADIELSEDERLKRIKRKGRKSTILARQGLDDKVELSKPTLLG